MNHTYYLLRTKTQKILGQSFVILRLRNGRKTALVYHAKASTTITNHLQSILTRQTRLKTAVTASLLTKKKSSTSQRTSYSAGMLIEANEVTLRSRDGLRSAALKVHENEKESQYDSGSSYPDVKIWL